MLGSWFTWKLLVESPKGLKTMFPSSFSLPADDSGVSHQSINNPSWGDVSYFYGVFRCSTYSSSPPSASHFSPESAVVISEAQTKGYKDRQRGRDYNLNLMVPCTAVSQLKVNSPCKPAWHRHGSGLVPEPSCSRPVLRPAYLFSHKAPPSSTMLACSRDSVQSLWQPNSQ